MIELVREPFDSDLWKRNVYKLHAQSPFPSADDIRAAIAAERPDIVFAFTPFNPSFVETLEQCGFHFMSIRSTYEWKGSSVAVSPPPESIQTFALSDTLTFSDDALEEIALTIGGTSRYMGDPRIPKENARKLYLAWLHNSLENGYVDEAFVLREGSRIVGLITLKVKNGTGFIDLVGVVPSHQSKGLGRYLIQRGMQYLQGAGVERIQVITEGENITANAFYQRNGFLVQQLALVYHWHSAYV